MQEQERLERVAIVVEFFGRLGRTGRDVVIDGLVRATATVPRIWLRAGATQLAGIWTHSMPNPTGADLYRAATQAAGFRPRYSAWGGYADPRPESVRWWPRPAALLPADLRERWGERAEALGVRGSVYVVPEQRRLAAPESRLALPETSTQGA